MNTENIQGIIQLLRKLQLKLKSAVASPRNGNTAAIKTQSRQGWTEAVRQAHENGDDQLIIPDVFPDE